MIGPLEGKNDWTIGGQDIVSCQTVRAGGTVLQLHPEGAVNVARLHLGETRSTDSVCCLVGRHPFFYVALKNLVEC